MSQPQSAPVVSALRQVVADTYALLGQSHLCHWNVRGKGFFALHQAFETQYNEMFAAVDEIAERIRSLGALAPGGLGNLAKLSGMEEIAEDADADTMVRHLAKGHGKVVESLKHARDIAEQAKDTESGDMCVARIQIHEKTIWMLRSYLD